VVLGDGQGNRSNLRGQTPLPKPYRRCDRYSEKHKHQQPDNSPGQEKSQTALRKSESPQFVIILCLHNEPYDGTMC
jgi:hypothetical protein